MEYNFRRYVIQLGTWVALVLGLAYLGAFWWIGGQGNLAVAMSLSTGIARF